MSEPLIDLVPKQAVDGVLGRAQLVAESVGTEDWNPSGLAVDCPALPGDPNIEVQKAGCVRQGRDHFTFNRNRVGDDFLVEGFAEDDGVIG